MFFVNSVLLGVGLAMDAFSVSIANAMNEPDMKHKRKVLIAGTFAFFQFLMPMIGWFCVHTVAEKFEAFQKYIPWIALILLCYIGGKMIYESVTNKGEEQVSNAVTLKDLFIQGVATSIDALSVGFTIAEYNTMQAIGSSLIIALVTFGICSGGLLLGRKAGEKLAGKAGIVGGIILIFIGIEIFIG